MRNIAVTSNRTARRSCETALLAVAVFLTPVLAMAQVICDNFEPIPPPPDNPCGGPCEGPPGAGSGGGGSGSGGPDRTATTGGGGGASGSVSLPGGAICRPPGVECRGSPNYVAAGAYATTALDLSIPTIGFPLQASR